jgi:hypothetical protein
MFDHPRVRSCGRSMQEPKRKPEQGQPDTQRRRASHRATFSIKRSQTSTHPGGFIALSETQATIITKTSQWTARRSLECASNRCFMSSASSPMSSLLPCTASHPRRSWVARLAALVVAALSGACGDAHLLEHDSVVDKSRRGVGPAAPIEVESVWVTLFAPDASTSHFSVETRGTQTAAIAFGHLAPGPYEVTFDAETTDGAACEGNATFEVAPNTAISVGFAVRCAQ